jgi:hypothetical protein
VLGGARARFRVRVRLRVDAGDRFRVRVAAWCRVMFKIRARTVVPVVLGFGLCLGQSLELVLGIWLGLLLGLVFD